MKKKFCLNCGRELKRYQDEYCGYFCEAAAKEKADRRTKQRIK